MLPAAWGFAGRRSRHLSRGDSPWSWARPPPSGGAAGWVGGGGRCLLVTRDRNLLVLNRDLFKVTKLPSPGASHAFGQDSPSDSRVSAALAVFPRLRVQSPAFPWHQGCPAASPVSSPEAQPLKVSSSPVTRAPPRV